MGDFQFWLYVIIGIIYLVTRLRKKNVVTEEEVPEFKPERNRRVQETQAKPIEKQLTFEELLREITEGKVETKPEPFVPPSTYKNYDEEVEEAEVLEDTDYDYRKNDSIYAQYEKAKTEAFERPSLEESMVNERTDMRFGKFKEFEIQDRKNLLDGYLSDFRDPVGLRKAIVMSEILKPKF